MSVSKRDTYRSSWILVVKLISKCEMALCMHAVIHYCQRDEISTLSSGMSAEEKADLEAMHANEKRLYDQLDRLDEELLESRDKTARAEADKQSLLDEFETLQAQVPLHTSWLCCDVLPSQPHESPVLSGRHQTSVA